MRAFHLASLLALFACSSPAPVTSSDGGVFKPPPGTDGGIKTDVGCATDTKLVYVISRDSYLYKFDPPTAAFTAGTSGCTSGVQASVPFRLIIPWLARTSLTLTAKACYPA